MAAKLPASTSDYAVTKAPAGRAALRELEESPAFLQ
jgi:hypothetical protein